jgi:two-component system chemotaxis response regulator CheB
MSTGFMSGFTEWLNRNSQLGVKIAEDGEILQNGTIYFAPDHLHLTVERLHKNLIARLVQSEAVSGFCPSITVLMKSIAKTSRNKAIGILLTGMGSDGAEGLLELKKAGGHTLIQDKESCVVFGMGNIAESLGAVDRIVKISQMADYIISMTSHRK